MGGCTITIGSLVSACFQKKKLVFEMIECESNFLDVLAPIPIRELKFEN